jgi:hypothetical protein
MQHESLAEHSEFSHKITMSIQLLWEPVKGPMAAGRRHRPAFVPRLCRWHPSAPRSCRASAHARPSAQPSDRRWDDAIGTDGEGPAPDLTTGKRLCQPSAQTLRMDGHSRPRGHTSPAVPTAKPSAQLHHVPSCTYVRCNISVVPSFKRGLQYKPIQASICKCIFVPAGQAGPLLSHEREKKKIKASSRTRTNLRTAHLTV